MNVPTQVLAGGCAISTECDPGGRIVPAVERISALQAVLGEGAWWDPADSVLWSVDILGKTLFRTDVASGVTATWRMPSEIGAACPRRAGGLIVCLRQGFAFFDPSSRELEVLFSPEPDLTGNRLNDAAVDPAGRLWAGSMDFDAITPTGTLYRLDPDLSCHPMDTGYVVTNGPAFSPDGRTLYHNDTTRGRVFEFDFDLDTGCISNKRLVIQLPGHGGWADGLSVDAAGDIWLCQVMAGRIGRYSPAGRLKQTIALPVPMVTSCCFGGPDLSVLYVTTARIMLAEAELAAYPGSGDLYAVQTDSRGQARTPFAG